MIDNREQWLLAAVQQVTPLFESNSYTVPKVRVSCGWPCRGALAAKKRRIGECWPKEAATDNVTQIFISPYLEDQNEIVAVLVHELVHAVVGCDKKHGKVFGKCARTMGLEGKLTATYAGPALKGSIEKWLKILDVYPHAKLDLLKSPVKKQTTRMVKCECGTCGYVCRTTKKWLLVGVPHCPDHGAMSADENEETTEDSND